MASLRLGDSGDMGGLRLHQKCHQADLLWASRTFLLWLMESKVTKAMPKGVS